MTVTQLKNKTKHKIREVCHPSSLTPLPVSDPGLGELQRHKPIAENSTGVNVGVGIKSNLLRFLWWKECLSLEVSSKGPAAMELGTFNTNTELTSCHSA